MHRNWLSDYIRAGQTPATSETLDKLSMHESSRIRRRVAENESTPEWILKRLSADKDPEVRLAAGTNRAAPLDIVLSLIRDPDPTVRHGLAEDPYISMGVLTKLAQDENPYVSCRAQKTLASFSSRLSKVKAKGNVFAFPQTPSGLDCLAT
ncbi:MAG: HEAT repeat domain-containing protein [Candidatus Obscuribacterales bacterium]|nr:HEAT repeat domain-containing protein [Candidatus Obscuribacterales bacterium]